MKKYWKYINPFKSFNISYYDTRHHVLQITVEYVHFLGVDYTFLERTIPFKIPLEGLTINIFQILLLFLNCQLLHVPWLVSFHQRGDTWQFSAAKVLFLGVFAFSLRRSDVHAESSISNIEKRLLMRARSRISIIHVVVTRILLVLLTSGGLAAIAFSTEGKIEIIATEANPITLSRHRCQNKSIISLLRWRCIRSHFEF